MAKLKFVFRDDEVYSCAVLNCSICYYYFTEIIELYIAIIYLKQVIIFKSKKTIMDGRREL